MSTNTRDWLLEKLLRATCTLRKVRGQKKTLLDKQASLYDHIADHQREITSLQGELKKKESELQQRRNDGDCQLLSRVHEMSLNQDLRVYVKDCFGQEYGVEILSRSSANGVTVIRGKIS